MCPLPSPAIKCDPAACARAAPKHVSLTRRYLGDNCRKQSHVDETFLLQQQYLDMFKKFL